MGKFIYNQNSFASGIVSKEFYARETQNAVSMLENMDIMASGAITRRLGLMRLVPLAGDAILVPFSMSETEDYLLAFYSGRIEVFHNGQLICNDLLTPWTFQDLQGLQYAQRFGTMIFVHPNHPPMSLKKNSTGFSLQRLDFSRNSSQTKNAPFMKFEDTNGISLNMTQITGSLNVNLTASAPIWDASDIGCYIFFLDQRWAIAQFISPSNIVVTAQQQYIATTDPIHNWKEQAFSGRRGWPCSITFHQDRLVFGGSRDYPSGVWMSKVGDHYNFDTGTGLDDEAIFITLMSEQRQQICTVVSSDNLQILTTTGEWAVSNKPLTPSSVDIKQHTNVGSIFGKYLQPQKIEGGTIFVARGGKDIRELALDELGENYNAKDLSAFSKHLMNSPCDMAFNDATGQLFVVMENGQMAVLNKFVTTNVSGWGIYRTDGKFLSVAILDNEVYVSVRRGNQCFIEKFSDTCLIDSDEYEFSYSVSGFPFTASGRIPKRARIYKLSARVLDTRSAFINNVRMPIPNEAVEVGFSGDLSVGQLGTEIDLMQPLWTISGSEQLPVTILSVTIDGWYQI